MRADGGVTKKTLPALFCLHSLRRVFVQVLKNGSGGSSGKHATMRPSLQSAHTAKTYAVEKAGLVSRGTNWGGARWDKAELRSEAARIEERGWTRGSFLGLLAGSGRCSPASPHAKTQDKKQTLIRESRRGAIHSETRGRKKERTLKRSLIAPASTRPRRTTQVSSRLDPISSHCFLAGSVY